MGSRTTEGCWEGELSGSPFSTAAAVIALTQVEESRPQFGVARLREKINAGLDWLMANANSDGGWGDVPQGKSNLMGAVCGWAALAEAAKTEKSYRAAAHAAENHLKKHCSQAGELSCAALSAALIAELGDSTLASSILTLCALSGRFGEGADACRDIPAVAFEKAAFPRSWFPSLQLTTLDSPIPALIAVGQLLHLRHPTHNPLRRPIRDFAMTRTLKLLEKLQVEGGGFLESIPVTSIVLAGMAGSGRISHLISKPCMEFLSHSQRGDGSWAVTPSVSVTVTSLALDALASPGYSLRADDAQAWLLEQQFQKSSLYSSVPAGGWGCTNLPGGAPDSHDTAAALLALWRIRSAVAVPRSEQRYAAAVAGVNWLFEAQNSNGGVATFSQGSEKMPFGAGSADLTAGAIRAWLAWRSELPSVRSKLDSSVSKAIAFLKKSQQDDGSWAALWLGNEQSPENFTYGTSRVLLALADVSVDPAKKQSVADMFQRGLQWLLKAQLPGGGGSVQAGRPISVEDTAWALEALAAAAVITESNQQAQRAVALGANWLAGEIESCQPIDPAPLGRLYSRLGYAERLHPLIFAVAALSRAKELL